MDPSSYQVFDMESLCLDNAVYLPVRGNPPKRFKPVADYWDGEMQRFRNKHKNDRQTLSGFVKDLVEKCQKEGKTIYHVKVMDGEYIRSPLGSWVATQKIDKVIRNRLSSDKPRKRRKVSTNEPNVSLRALDCNVSGGSGAD